MSSRFLSLCLAASLVAGASETRELRICADPNNLPFSNRQEEGFENKIAKLIAADLGAEITYQWRAWHRSFLRETLNTKTCDVVMGVPSNMPKLTTTKPYYTSTYAFVTQAKKPIIASFDDPALSNQKIGVQMIGDDGEGTPPAYALAKRGMIENMKTYTSGDYEDKAPASGIVDAVAKGDVDMAIVWGPIAGFFAARQAQPLAVTPVSPQFDGPSLPMTFSIAIGLRNDSAALRDEINKSLDHLRPQIDAILAEYHVPRLDEAQAP